MKMSFQALMSDYELENLDDIIESPDIVKNFARGEYHKQNITYVIIVTISIFRGVGGKF